MTRSAVPAVGLMFIALSAGSVSAQPRPPVVNRPPAFSPYLNLLRGGVSPAVNYYGIVRPQQQFRQQAQVLEQQIYQNSMAVQSLGVTGLAQQQPFLATTGHPVAFNNYGGYFNNLSGGGAVGGGSPGILNSPLPGYAGGGFAREPGTPGPACRPGSPRTRRMAEPRRDSPRGRRSPPRPVVPVRSTYTPNPADPATPTPATPGGAVRPRQ